MYYRCLPLRGVTWYSFHSYTSDAASAQTGRYMVRKVPKCCDIRQRFRTLNVIHAKWQHSRTCDGLSEQATQKVKKVIRLRPLLNEGGHNIPVKQYINYLPERLLFVD